MAEDLIGYDQLSQEAMRDMIAKLLRQVATQGLPGEHHFFISFDTRAKGVRLSARLKANYPTDMTIVLQHQFWELTADLDQFSIQLSFDNIPERLTIPYSAIKGFYDPSVHFAVQFGLDDDLDISDFDPDKDHAGGLAHLRSIGMSSALESGETAGADFGVSSGEHRRDNEIIAQLNQPQPDDLSDDIEVPPAHEAEIVRLDNFRKKN